MLGCADGSSAPAVPAHFLSRMHHSLELKPARCKRSLSIVPSQIQLPTTCAQPACILANQRALNFLLQSWLWMERTTRLDQHAPAQMCLECKRAALMVSGAFAFSRARAATSWRQNRFDARCVRHSGKSVCVVAFNEVVCKCLWRHLAVITKHTWKKVRIKPN